MIRDYTLTSPSLDGILRHASVEYEGLSRPPEVKRLFDRPRYSKMKPEGPGTVTGKNRELVERYFQDLYGVLVKNISEFAMETSFSSERSVKLTAMLQELIKVKSILCQD